MRAIPVVDSIATPARWYACTLSALCDVFSALRIREIRNNGVVTINTAYRKPVPGSLRRWNFYLDETAFMYVFGLSLSLFAVILPHAVKIKKLFANPHRDV